MCNAVRRTHHWQAPGWSCTFGPVPHKTANIPTSKGLHRVRLCGHRMYLQVAWLPCSDSRVCHTHTKEFVLLLCLLVVLL